MVPSTILGKLYGRKVVDCPREPGSTGTSMTLYGRILISKKQSISALVKKRCARVRAHPEKPRSRSRSPVWKIFRSRSWLKSAAHFLRSPKVKKKSNFLRKFQSTFILLVNIKRLHISLDEIRY